MEQIYVKRAAGRLLPVILALALAGCTTEPIPETPVELFNDTIHNGKWTQLPASPENRIEPITLVHGIAFGDDSADIATSERNRLAEFLSQSQATTAMRIELDGPRGEDGHHDPLTAARIEALRSEVMSQGFRAEVPVTSAYSSLDADDMVMLAVTRLVVILPDCTQAQPIRGRRPQFDWDCANTANFGLMVANPSELERGTEISPADGEETTLSIQRYRTGKVLPLDKEDTTGK